MRAADVTIAVDGGIQAFIDANQPPDLLVGDLDSIPDHIPFSVTTHRLPDQSLTDLQKTLVYAAEHYSLTTLVLLGAGGLRTDHWLHNLHFCSELDPQVKVVMKSELIRDGNPSLEIIQRITPVVPFDQPVSVDSVISILPICDFTGLSSQGLRWEIEDASRSTGFISQSNYAIQSDPTFSILDGCAYIAVYQ